MNIPKNLKYSKSHEWIRVLDNGHVLVGITDYAQSQMGDIVFFNLINAGDKVEAGKTIGDMESIKAVADIYAPVAGKVVKVNNDVLDNPSLANTATYDSWLIELTEVSGLEALLDSEAYTKLV